MNQFKDARNAARLVWQRSMSSPLLSPEELRDLELAICDLEHALKAHSDAVAEARRKELERVA